MTTDANRRVLDQAGQSVIEFILMLPVILALLVVMIRVNSVIQISIVNQQYARAQAHWLTFNNNTYPELRQRVRNFQTEKQGNEMILGVAGNTVSEDEPDNYHPEAAIQNVARKTNGGGSDEPQTEPDPGVGRSKVRVRTTVGICTAPFVSDEGALLPLNAQPPFAPTGPYNLKEGTQFPFCKRPT